MYLGSVTSVQRLVYFIAFVHRIYVGTRNVFYAPSRLFVALLTVKLQLYGPGEGRFGHVVPACVRGIRKGNSFCDCGQRNLCRAYKDRSVANQCQTPYAVNHRASSCVVYRSL